MLLLFASGPTGPDVLLVERASGLRSHAGQVAFPGGAIDPGETPERAALREAHEETGLDVSGVDVAAVLADRFVPPSGFIVSPVLAYWTRPSPVAAVDEAEVASVHRVAIATLADPANRFRVRHPSGLLGPAFAAHRLLVWGFTAGLLDRLLHLAGWERPWDGGAVHELPQPL